MEETPTTAPDWTPRVPETHTHCVSSRPIHQRREGKPGNRLWLTDFGMSQLRWSYRMLRRNGCSAVVARDALWNTAWTSSLKTLARPVFESFDGEVYR